MDQGPNYANYIFASVIYECQIKKGTAFAFSTYTRFEPFTAKLV
jgi:hypothetical protein